jgi:hypothetical protein
MDYCAVPNLKPEKSKHFLIEMGPCGNYDEPKLQI